MCDSSREEITETVIWLQQKSESCDFTRADITETVVSSQRKDTDCESARFHDNSPI